MLLIDRLRQTRKQQSQLTILDTQSIERNILVRLKTHIDEQQQSDFSQHLQTDIHQIFEDSHCEEQRFQTVERLFVISFRAIAKATMLFDCETE